MTEYNEVCGGHSAHLPCICPPLPNKEALLRACFLLDLAWLPSPHLARFSIPPTFKTWLSPFVCITRKDGLPQLAVLEPLIHRKICLTFSPPPKIIVIDNQLLEDFANKCFQFQKALINERPFQLTRNSYKVKLQSLFSFQSSILSRLLVY